jgi:2-aminoadipate transaminase
MEDERVSVDWERLFEGTEHRLRSSAIRDLLAVTAQPDVISFAGGLPAPELFPVAAVRESFDRVLRDQGAGALQYGPTEGHMPLREYLAAQLNARGIAATADQVLITTGSQQALHLVGEVLLGHGSSAMIEAPSYVGALQAFTLREPRYVPIAMDDEGMVAEQAGEWLARAARMPAFIYTVATFQNPSGVTMSLPRRASLLEIANRHGVPIVEDNPYGELRFEGDTVPSFRALPGGGDAVYLGTFSKVLTPGLRVGYAVAPRPLLARMILAKQAADLHTDSLSQRAVLDFCQHNDLAAHVETLRETYRERRQAMMAAMEKHFPGACRWTRPAGGLFTWVTLPDHLDATTLLREAVARKVVYVPGAAFFTDGSGANTLRLNFSHPNPDKIEEGIRRLGALFAEAGGVGDERRALAGAL